MNKFAKCKKVLSLIKEAQDIYLDATRSSARPSYPRPSTALLSQAVDKYSGGMPLINEKINTGFKYFPLLFSRSMEDY